MSTTVSRTEMLKLGLLGTILCFCVSTLFTTWSFHMGGRDLVRIRPQTERYCAPFRRAAVCDSDPGSADCQRQRRSLQTCQDAIQQAFAHINLGGCIRPQQVNTLCELEWCADGGGSATCRTECASVRQALADCIQDHVQQSFHAHGLVVTEATTMGSEP